MTHRKQKKHKIIKKRGEYIVETNNRQMNIKQKKREKQTEYNRKTKKTQTNEK